MCQLKLTSSTKGGGYVFTSVCLEIKMVCVRVSVRLSTENERIMTKFLEVWPKDSRLSQPRSRIF